MNYLNVPNITVFLKEHYRYLSFRPMISHIDKLAVFFLEAFIEILRRIDKNYSIDCLTKSGNHSNQYTHAVEYYKTHTRSSLGRLQIRIFFWAPFGGSLNLCRKVFFISPSGISRLPQLRRRCRALISGGAVKLPHRNNRYSMIIS